VVARNVQKVPALLVYNGPARVAAHMLTPLTPQTLRRSMATAPLTIGVREEAVSTLLGHAATQTTRVAYARLSIPTLADAVNQAMASNPGQF
jgi:site-specific recombinase XerD